MKQGAALTKAPQVGTETNRGAAGKANQDSMATFRVGPGDLESWGTQPEQSLYIAAVADGVTGQAAGAQASQIAVETLKRTLQQNRHRIQGAEVPRLLEEAIQAGNRAILKTTEQNPDQRGMSTTLVVAAVVGWTLYVAHIGDSRAYLIRGKAVYRLTLDHTWVQQALDVGRLREDESLTHPNRHVLTEHLGTSTQLQIDHKLLVPGSVLYGPDKQLVNALPLESGDVILLCSDGVSDKVTTDEISQLVGQARPSAAKIAQRLVKSAYDKHETDNITAAVLVMPGTRRLGIGAFDTSKLPLSPLLLALITIFLVGSLWLILSQWGSLSDGGTPPTATAITPAQTVADAPTATVPTTVTLAAPPPATVNPSVALTTSAAATTAPISGTTDLTGTTGVTSTSSVTATVTSTVTPSPTATMTPRTKPTATRLALTATPTPSATATPPPSPTPGATRTRAASTPQSAAVGSSGDCANCAIQIIGPTDPVLSGRQTFSWQPNFTLGNDYLFELVFWAEGETAMANGRSPVGAGSATTIALEIDRVIATLQLQPNKPYYWGVLLVKAPATTERVKLLSPGLPIQVQTTSSGGNSDSGNSGEAAPEPTPR